MVQTGFIKKERKDSQRNKKTPLPRRTGKGVTTSGRKQLALLARSAAAELLATEFGRCPHLPVELNKMSSVEHLRGFVTERLTAAAEEIFGVFHRTIAAYEAEVERQRGLLKAFSRPEIKLHRLGLYTAQVHLGAG